MTADSEYLRSIALGYRLSQALYVFAELGVADILATGPATATVLAGKTATDPDALRRLLRVGRAMGLVAESPDGTYAITERGRLLDRTADRSQWSRVRAVGETWHWASWGRLLDSVTQGRPAFELAYGTNSFDYFEKTPGTGDTMMRRVTVEAELRGAGIAGAFDFASVRRVVDLGGGRGAILAAILHRHPHLRGVLVDLPYAVAGADDVLDERGVRERCDVVAGDFRTEIPAGGDAYLLSAVLHSWNDDDSVDLLRRCFAAADRVIVVDEVLHPTEDAMAALLKDLHLMVFSGGRQRTLGEFRELFERAGGRLVRQAEVRPGELLMEGFR